MFNKYLVDFYRVLFNRFRCKRDNFKINEQVLMDIHSCVSREQNDIDLSEVDLSGVDLLTKFELYAECVHKYLPQIRQHNQYLLFHYIWTMQVQYLAPFFNYICDFYRAYNWKNSFSKISSNFTYKLPFAENYCSFNSTSNNWFV